MTDTKLFRLSGSASVIDLRTGHNATLRPGLVVLSEDAHTHAIAALHAEAEALRVALLEIASANPAERGIEWAKSYASDGLKGAGSELYARWLETFKEAEALRAENGRLQADRDRANQYANQQALECNKLSTDLEAARGLLRESRKSYTEAIHWEDQQPVMKKIDAFLTAFPVPEVRCQTCDGTGDVHRSDGEWLGECHCVKTEQGERQEPVAWALANSADEIGGFAPIYYTKEGAISWANGRNIFPLYTTPQPGPDVRGLVSADDVRDACANAVSVFAEEVNADQCREAVEYMREVLLAQIAKQQAKGKGGKHE